jgi:hypothetical protein
MMTARCPMIDIGLDDGLDIYSLTPRITFCGVFPFVSSLCIYMRTSIHTSHGLLLLP